MGQQPNIEIEEGELPRSEPERAPERRWSPTRPGEITSPEDVPTASLFGRPGPDSGYALKLIRRAEFERSDRPQALEQVLTAIVAARAAASGRAPVPVDVNVALSILGLRGDDLEPATLDHLAVRRADWLDAVPHESAKGSTALAAIPRELLLDTPVRVRARLNAQPALVG